MKIYRLMQTELYRDLFTEVRIKNEESVQWAVTIPKDVVVVKNIEEAKKLAEAALEEAEATPRKGRYERMCEACNRSYAVEYDTDELSMETLLELLYSKLSSQEVQFICEKEKWVAERFSDYLKNPFRNEEFKQEFEKIRATNGTDQNIKNLAMLAFANSMLSNFNNS